MDMTKITKTGIAVLLGLTVTACGQSGKPTASACSDAQYAARGVATASDTYGFDRNRQDVRFEVVRYDQSAQATVNVTVDGATHPVDVQCVNGHAEVSVH